ncbi:MAG: M48 family metallopeptidase [Verrucomicrobiota bacterium]
MNTDSLLDRMRFAPEKQMVEQVMETFCLEPILSHFEQEGGVKSVRDGVLGQHLKLTRTMAPRLFSAMESVRRLLEYDAPVDLFVAQNSDINALGIYSLDSTPHMVGLTSQLIERMTDVELKFVLGHEIGHLWFKHYRMQMVTRAFGKDNDGDSRVPSLLARRLEIWQRLAELSADRAGFVAAGGQLDPVVSAFFKISSGLGPEHLQFNISAFLQQLEELKQLERRDSICDFSHPVIPIRVRALQLYRDAGGAEASSLNISKVDIEVTQLARLMDREPTEPEEIHKLNFVLAGGVLIGQADGKGLGEDESRYLVEMLMPLTSDPEESIAGITSVAQAEKMLAESAAWIKENTGEVRFNGFRYLCIIAAVEGMTLGEEHLLYRIAEMAGIPRRAAGDLIHEVLTNFAPKIKAVGGAMQRLK